MAEKFNKYPLIFTHIPRSAGTTLVDILSRHFSKKEQFHFYVREKGGIVNSALQDFNSLSTDKKKEFKLLQGHINFGIHKHYHEYTYITLMRNPVERIVSYYYYVISNSHHYLHGLIMSSQMNLEKFVSCEFSTELDNMMTRQLSGVPNVPFGKCNNEMLRLAKFNLLNQFKVFGITEKFDESLILMKRHFDWSFPYYLKLNTNTKKPPKSTITDEVIALIEKYNSYDMELYKFGLSLFESRIKQQGESFSNEFKKFQRYNRALQKIYKYLPQPIGAKLWNIYVNILFR